MQFAICTVPAAPVRTEPAHRSEMSNQLLFGDTMEILEEKGEWFKVKSTYDQYEGWLTWHLVNEVPEALARQEPFYYASGLTNPITLTDSLLHAPMGSALVGYDAETRWLWNKEYKYHGTVKDIRQPFDQDLLIGSAHSWLNAPYLWGGKTLMGVDCSGFVQTLFKLLGIKLCRDAYQQAEQGQPHTLEEARLGDLAFFHNEAGRITHVGLVWNAHQIIHASGRVRIDTLNKEGITNSTTGKRTHQLHSLRRFF
jgi:gamma-D-glutamyl-L-lysine dipeptidyl-peptidase